jgi:imidazoleglycerol-phosphate dehydratase/histidinol-phosphatase
MNKKKILFIDRDGTLINEPKDKQIDSLEKLKLEPFVIPTLLKLQQAGFIFVIISNQDGLGTKDFPHKSFKVANDKMLDLFKSQGITFADIKICPHLPSDACECRKPKLGLVLSYIREQKFDREHSYVIGDRKTDMELAKSMGIKGILYGKKKSWLKISQEILTQNRRVQIERVTNETSIDARIDLEIKAPIDIKTGIGFFDHMLEQLAKHGGFSLILKVKGDLNVDEHHTVEDTGLALGKALRKALGNKLGIARYGFFLPMDESLAQIAIDLSGRPYLVFACDFKRDTINKFPTELVQHFFRSFAESLKATINIKAEGENTHHLIESIFKGVGRALNMAIKQDGYDLPSNKGVL